MTYSSVLVQDDLQSRLDYNPETGLLFWKYRPLCDFPNRGVYTSFNNRLAGKPALNSVHKSGYLSGTYAGETFKAHRVIFALVHGYLPEEIDHINGVRTDNRICNLRAVTKAENAKNRKAARNTSGAVGVHFSAQHQKWVAYINGDKKRVYLGIFADKTDAIAARAVASEKYGYHPNNGRFADGERSSHGDSL